MNQKILVLMNELRKEADDIYRAIDILSDTIKEESQAASLKSNPGIIAVSLAGKTLGDVPVRKLSRMGRHLAEKRMGVRSAGKRPYTKRSKFWAKKKK